MRLQLRRYGNILCIDILYIGVNICEASGGVDLKTYFGV